MVEVADGASIAIALATLGIVLRNTRCIGRIEGALAGKVDKKNK